MIDVQITPEGLKEVSYVVVTMKLKDSNMETKGLFIGYRPIVDRDMDLATLQERYIWLYREGCVHMFSTTYYDIEAIDIGVSQGKDPVAMLKSFTTDANSQIDARRMLNNIIDAFRENKMIEFNGLIKHTLYKVPDKYKKMLDTKSTHKPSSSTARTGIAGYSTGHTPYNYNRNNTTTWKRKEVSTTNMKRTTRYNIGMAMAAVADKFKALKDETYVPPKLPKIPADSMEENGDDKATIYTYDDYSNYCGY